METVATFFLKNITNIIAVTLLSFFLMFCADNIYAQVGIPADGVDLDGYAWSSNIGWISFNCKTGGFTGQNICSGSGSATPVDYKVSISKSGEVTGYAWSSNIGWIKFGGLNSFPSGGGTISVNARVTGTYPNLSLEGWARACAGDNMDSDCKIISSSVPETSWVWSMSGTDAPLNFNVRLIGGAGLSSPIVHGNGTYVALTSSRSAFMTSVDGKVWVARSAPMGEWNSLAFGNGVFIAVSSDFNRVARSVDGITWTVQWAPANAWTSVAFGNGLFAAVACGTGTTCNENAGARVMTSPDGISWTAQVGIIKTWNAVTYGGGQFVAVSESNGGGIMTSPDGVSWTFRDGQGAWNDVQYGNGMYVATPWVLNTILTSPDGVTWTSRTISGVEYTAGLTFSNGQFVTSVKRDGYFTVLTSPDGIAWTESSYFNSKGAYGVLGAGLNEIVIGGGMNGGYVFNKSYKAVIPGSSSSGTDTGWDGWISLKGTSPAYGVSITLSGSNVGSYAWGSGVIGWIDFRNVKYLATTGSVVGTNCVIPQAASTCGSLITWNIVNSSSPILRNDSNSINYSTASSGTDVLYQIKQGSNTVQLLDSTLVIDETNLVGSCMPGTDFSNGVTCELSPAPVPVVSLTVSPSLVRKGGATNISWDISPPQAIGCVLSGPNVTSPNDVITGLEPIKTRSFAVNNTSIFTATCTGAYGTVTKAVRVDVVPTAQEV